MGERAEAIKALLAAKAARQHSSHLWEEADAAVIAARQAGASWQQIADALGVTRQGAWSRYARKVPK